MTTGLAARVSGLARRMGCSVVVVVGVRSQHVVPGWRATPVNVTAAVLDQRARKRASEEHRQDSQRPQNPEPSAAS